MLKHDPEAKDSVRSPEPGEIFKNPTLAQTFRTLAKEGKKGFYQGRIGQALVQVTQDLGGHLTLDDLKYHMERGSQEVDAISLKFTPQDIAGSQCSRRGEVEVWEHPPNGQGIV